MYRPILSIAGWQSMHVYYTCTIYWLFLEFYLCKNCRCDLEWRFSVVLSYLNDISTTLRRLISVFVHL